MSNIRDYLVTLPRDVLSRVSIEETRTVIPTDIDATVFGTILSGNIFKDGLSIEKSIFASLGTSSSLKSIEKLLDE